MSGQPGQVYRYVMGGGQHDRAVWLADDLDECIAKVRELRGILRIGSNGLYYDLTRWAHLVDHERGVPRGTCRRCGVFARTGRWASGDENYDCPGEVWDPGRA